MSNLNRGDGRKSKFVSLKTPWTGSNSNSKKVSSVLMVACRPDGVDLFFNANF